MEKDFHYHIIYSLARCTGYDRDEAWIIAYSSQFVDDNNEGPFSVNGGEILFPKKLHVHEGTYHPLMTQFLSPKSLDFYVQKYVYMPFHFFPGDGRVSIKGKKNPYCVEPGSSRARRLLEGALESGDLYAIGIALHTYVDTWSHQNFTAYREDWNSVYPWYNVFKSYVPNIGHAEAGHAPDIISARWIDNRLGDDEIDNRTRAMEAIKSVFEVLSQARGGEKWESVERAYWEIVKVKNYDERIKVNALFVEKKFNEKIPYYDKSLWIGEALTCTMWSDNWAEELVTEKGEDDLVRVSPRAGFKRSHWYLFQQAAKAHLARAMELVKGI